MNEPYEDMIKNERKIKNMNEIILLYEILEVKIKTNELDKILII